jgi:hypothetical protein
MDGRTDGQTDRYSVIHLFLFYLAAWLSIDALEVKISELSK